MAVPQLHLGALTIMSARPRVLARFYSALLGWPYVREEEPARGNPPDTGYALVCPPEGVAEPALNFDYDPHYRRPVWPGIAGEQASTQHLDLGASDLEAAVRRAVDCGATQAEFQPAPDRHRVMIDPEGHPFCLCRS